MAEIDLRAWLANRLSPGTVTATESLPGRETAILNPIPRHTILGLPLDEVPDGCEVAYFAMGCYWGAEKLFWTTPGVANTAVGFMGGYTPNPTYRETCTGRTGHTETVRVTFDPNKVSYGELLKVFWENHDPTQGNRQGNDVGDQYRSAIFATSPAQLAEATTTKQSYEIDLAAAGYSAITTEISDAKQFYYAEDEHQQYLDKKPGGYCPVHATGVTCNAEPPSAR